MADAKKPDLRWVQAYVKKWEPQLLSIKAMAEQHRKFFDEMLPKCIGMAKSAQEIIDGMKKNMEEKVERARQEERARSAKPATKRTRTRKAGRA
jgi:hypothetical protein